MARTLRLGIVGLLACGAVVFTGMPASASSNHTWVVEPGTGTISAAVRAASPGDTLRLEEGTFYDSVFIGRLDAQGNPKPKPLTIRGEGDDTVIKPPAGPSTNPCNSPGAVEGLCVTGQLDAQGNPVLSNPVHDVRISDLRTTGFSDSGVIGFNTEGLEVQHVRSDHNGGYGIARFASSDSLFEDNGVSYNGEAGLYVGDSPNAHSVVRGNWANNNGFGIFLRDSTMVEAEHNVSWGNCVGILALNTGHGATGPSGAGQYSIHDNTVRANDRSCPGNGGPPTSGIGIALAGVRGTKVFDNEVSDNKPSGPSLASGGVVIVSGATSAPSNNLVTDNKLDGNKPADIFWDRTGTGNKVRANDCDTAIPANLGWCS